MRLYVNDPFAFTRVKSIYVYTCDVYLFVSLDLAWCNKQESFLHARENATQYERSSVRDEKWIGISISPLAGQQEICVRWFLCGKHVVLAKVTMAHRTIDLWLY